MVEEEHPLAAAVACPLVVLVVLVGLLHRVALGCLEVRLVGLAELPVDEVDRLGVLAAGLLVAQVDHLVDPVDVADPLEVLAALHPVVLEDPLEDPVDVADPLVDLVDLEAQEDLPEDPEVVRHLVAVADHPQEVAAVLLLAAAVDRPPVEEEAPP